MRLEQTLRKLEEKKKTKAKEEVAKRTIDLGLEASVITADTGSSPEEID